MMFIILVSLTMILFSEKMLISTRFIHGFMSNLIKKSWTDLRPSLRKAHLDEKLKVEGGLHRMPFLLAFFRIFFEFWSDNKGQKSKKSQKTSPKGVSASKCEMGILLNLNLKQGIKVILYLHTFSSKEFFWKFLGNSFGIFQMIFLQECLWRNFLEGFFVRIFF